MDLSGLNGNDWNDDLDTDDKKYYALYYEQMRSFDMWTEKLVAWDAFKIFEKLRTLDVHTSRSAFEDDAEAHLSAYSLFSAWRERYARNDKFHANFGFILASVGALWSKLTPDLFNIETFLMQNNVVAGTRDKMTAHNALVLHLQNWAELAELLDTDLADNIAIEQLHIEPTWFVEPINNIAKVCIEACTEKNKLLSEVATWYDTVKKRFPDTFHTFEDFLVLHVWLSVVNNKDATVRHAVANFVPTALNARHIYNMLGDLYKNPLPFAFNTPDEARAMEYYAEFLKRVEEEAKP